MKRKLVLFGLLLILVSSMAAGQDKKIEINGVFGYTFSEGVDINPQEFNDLTIDRISPKSGYHFGAGFDYFLGENFSLGFNWAQERSKLRGRARGSESLDFTDMSVNNYHGILAYNFGDEDEPLRPFFFGGLGATHYNPGSIEGQPIDSSTRFSTTWGGGVKFYASDHIGFKGSARWTPTYIKSDPGGVWCSPYWPWSCWVVGNPNYSHQFELSAGVIFRF